MTDTDKLLAEPAEKAPLPGPKAGMDMTSPVDLPAIEGEEGSGLLWASIAIAVATGFLLLFNASALRGWAFELEPGPWSERIVALADDWYQRTESLYLDRPVAAMSGWWDAIKALEFGSGEGPDDPAADGAADGAAAEPAAERPPEPGFSIE